LTAAEVGVHDDPVVATVLVVDDEQIVREVVVRYLEREGYATLEAGTVTERASSSRSTIPTWRPRLVHAALRVTRESADR
jgi:CheY-like chemotaxis protein